MEAREVIEGAGDAQSDLRAILADWVKGDKERDRREAFCFRAALLVAYLALILALVNVLGDNVIEDMMHANFVSSDLLTVAIPVEDLETRLAFGSPNAGERQNAQERIDRLTTLANEFDPNVKGQTLRRALLDEANRYHHERDVFLEKDKNFDFAQVFLEIAIVVASVSIFTVNRWLIMLAVAGGVVGTALMVNGLTLWVNLPLG